MSGKTFAQINCSLLRSKKLKDCSHQERWAYLCAHLTPLASFSGMFNYPQVMWAQDASITIDEMGDVVTNLCDRNLLEYDGDEELLRVVGFHRQRPPENASRVISLANDFLVAPLDTGHRSGMRLRAIAEFTVASVQRAQSWKAESSDRAKVRETLKPFTAHFWQEHEHEFGSAILEELIQAAQSVKYELSTLMPMLATFETSTVPTPCQHHGGIRDVDETRLRGDVKKDGEDTKTPQKFREIEAADVSKVEGMELLRNSDSPNRSTPTSGPRDSTKRSALVVGINR